MMRSLQHYAFEVPDAEVGRRFYADFGLEARDDGNGVAMGCAGRDQDQVVLIEGAKKKRLHHIGLGTAADEIDGIKATLEGRGVKLLDPPYDGARDGLWFHDTDGVLVNMCVAKDMPARAELPALTNTTGHVLRHNVRGVAVERHVARPRRLGHILMFTPDVTAKVEFYTRALGMKLSDTMGGDVVAFLRPGNNGDHHVIALAKSEKPGFHHASFEFGSIDDIGVAVANMLDKGHRHCWGFGRHVVGSNYFHYVRDPWGSLVEHFADIDVIDDDSEWEVRDWPLEGNFCRWATEPDPPEDFLHNFDA